MTGNDTELLALQRIVQTRLTLRGRGVVLDSDLSELYGISMRRFNSRFRRNLARFPDDFAFQLSEAEAESLQPKIATQQKGRRADRRNHLPYAFTEQGVLMTAMIFDSARAVEMIRELMTLPPSDRGSRFGTCHSLGGIRQGIS